MYNLDVLANTYTCRSIFFAICNFEEKTTTFES